jgi:hypothetical protein
MIVPGLSYVRARRDHVPPLGFAPTSVARRRKHRLRAVTSFRYLPLLNAVLST